MFRKLMLGGEGEGEGVECLLFQGCPDIYKAVQ